MRTKIFMDLNTVIHSLYYSKVELNLKQCHSSYYIIKQQLTEEVALISSCSYCWAICQRAILSSSLSLSYFLIMPSKYLEISSRKMLYKDVYLRCYIKPRNKYQNVTIKCSKPKNYSKNKIFIKNLEFYEK